MTTIHSRWEGGIVSMPLFHSMWETWVLSPGWEDPLEKGMATRSSILARRITMDRGAWRATGHRVAKGRTQLSE